MDTTVNLTKEEAYKYLAEGYFDDAVEAFSGCLRLSPSDASIYYGRGMSYFQLKKWHLAVVDFGKARDLDGQNYHICMALALSLAMDSKIYEAISVYETLLVNNPQLVRAHIQLAMLYYRLGTITKGHRQLDIALASRPSLAERKNIEELKKEQLALDKKRYYRPDFEALHKQGNSAE